MKSTFPFIKAVANRAAMILIWLVIFGASADLESPWGIIVGVLAVVIFVVIHVGKKRPIGWDFGRLRWNLPRWWTLLLAITILVLIGDIFWIFHIKTPDEEFGKMPLAMSILAVIGFPLVEEFGFRLWLQTYLEQRLRPYVAVVIIAVLFASFHSADLPITQLFSGILYGVALVVSGSIWVPVLLHIVHNAILISLDNSSIVIDWVMPMLARDDALNLSVAIACWLVGGGLLTFWVRIADGDHTPSS